MTDVHSALAELGAAVGRAIYFVDALEDLDKDLRRREFNPCILHARRDERRVRECVRLLRADVDALPSLLDALPLARHASVLHDIGAALAARAERAIADVDRTRPSTRVRLQAFAIAAALFVWAWLCAIPRAFADGAPDAGRPDAGVDAGPLFPELPPFPSAAPPPPRRGHSLPMNDAGASTQNKPDDSGTLCPCRSLWNALCGENSCCNACTNCCNNCGDCGTSCDKLCTSCGSCCGGGGTK